MVVMRGKVCFRRAGWFQHSLLCTPYSPPVPSHTELSNVFPIQDPKPQSLYLDMGSVRIEHMHISVHVCLEQVWANT